MVLREQELQLVLRSNFKTRGRATSKSASLFFEKIKKLFGEK